MERQHYQKQRNWIAGDKNSLTSLRSKVYLDKSSKLFAKSPHLKHHKKRHGRARSFSLGKLRTHSHTTQKMVKPAFSVEEVAKFATELYGLRITSAKELPSYDDQNVLVDAEEIDPTGGHSLSQQLVFKFGHSDELREVLEFQIQLINRLKERMPEKVFPVPLAPLNQTQHSLPNNSSLGGEGDQHGGQPSHQSQVKNPITAFFSFNWRTLYCLRWLYSSCRLLTHTKKTAN
jgi:hypothetical protein